MNVEYNLNENQMTMFKFLDHLQLCMCYYYFNLTMPSYYIIDGK
jgi:hypothetical protein